MMDPGATNFDDPTPLGQSEPSLGLPLIVGAGAAAIGGLAWAGITAVTNVELGIAAWALGAAVGLAMSRVTTRRDMTVGILAAFFAFMGLVTARVVIAEYVLPRQMANEILKDPRLLAEATAFDLQLGRGFPADIQQEYDLVPHNEAVSDELYSRMVAAGSAHLEKLSNEERERIASQYVTFSLIDFDLPARVMTQVSPYDLLWVFLALSSAFKIMSGTAASAKDADKPLSIK